MIFFIKRQLKIIYKGGLIVYLSKIFKIILKFPIYLIFLPFLTLVRIISPFYIIRFNELYNSRIGHLGANTELYLCEIDAHINTPNKLYYDIFYLSELPTCNIFLLNKLRDNLNIWPRWAINYLRVLNEFIPYGKNHIIGTNLNHDRDINNLLDQYPSHFKFTKDEEINGQNILNEMGINVESKFVCLLVRDNAYLNSKLPQNNWDYHNYRDSDIDNYLIAAEFLADQGFFVLRMGRDVNKKFISSKVKIIDYANSKWASDFMDIYLGAKCNFCISTGSGGDAIPAWVFRKPTIFTNLVPFGYLPTFSDKYFLTTKRHYSEKLNRELTISEIFKLQISNCMQTSIYNDNRIKLIENTPFEILDVVKEMLEFLNGRLILNESEKIITNRFWNLYSELNNYYSSNMRLHGEFKAKFSITYLKKNPQWVS